MCEPAARLFEDSKTVTDSVSEDLLIRISHPDGLSTGSPADKSESNSHKMERGRRLPGRISANDGNSQEARELLSYLARGDSSAFWSLWTRYQKYLYGLCLRQMGGVHVDAEDALSQAMLRARDRLPYYADRITDIRAWLGRLILNLCIDIHRERNRRTRGTVSMEEIAGSDKDIMLCSSHSPEEAFLAREMIDCIRRAIEELPPRLREPYLLRSLQQTPYREIATRLHVSSDNARKRVQQARLILRGRITEYVFGFRKDRGLPLTLANNVSSSEMINSILCSAVGELDFD